MDDLQAMVDSLRLSEPVDRRQMDDLAGMLKEKLQLNLDQSAYRQLAENMVNLSIQKNTSSFTRREDPSNYIQKHHQPQQSSFIQHPNSSFSNLASSSFSLPVVNYGYRIDNNKQYHHDVIEQQNKLLPQTHQPIHSPPVLSPNVTQRRGRSPARSLKSNDINKNPKSRMSPIRQIFGGGIPRAGLPTSNGTHGTTSKTNVTSERTRTVSPGPGSGFSMFRRNNKGQEEKKESDKTDVSVSGGTSSVNSVPSVNHQKVDLPSTVLPRMDHFNPGSAPVDQSRSSHRPDQSSGSSPQRNDRPVGIAGNGRCQSPVIGSNQMHGPQFSPGRIPLMRHSAPNSPLYSTMGVSSSDRPPSRSGSPFSRPGLEDYGGGGETISGRSPRREQGTSVSKPSVPFHHRRNRSSGVDVDMESSRQPQIPRSISSSPLRRPSPAPEQDSDSIRQPAPPRSYSHSPVRNHRRVESNFDEDLSSVGISMPDLSIPDFDPATTPPSIRLPMHVTANAMDVEQSFSKTGKNDRRGVNDSSSVRSVPELHLRPIPNEDEIRFQLGTGRNNKHQRGPPRHTSSRRPDGRVDSEFLDNRNETTPVPNNTETRERIFSPMEVETDVPEPGPPEGFTLGVAQPRPRRKAPPHKRHPSLDSHEQEAREGLIPPNLHNSFSHEDATVPSHPTSAEISPAKLGIQQQTVDYSGLTALINSKREEAKSFYLAGDYTASINAYTDAIKAVGIHENSISGDTCALLFSNRAAALLMVGAFDAAVSDCQTALKKVTMPRASYEAFSADSGLLLKIKLHTRMGRAYLKLGDYNEAHLSFSDAIRTTEEAMAFSEANHPHGMVVQNQATLGQMNTEATLGQADARRLREACENLTKYTLQHSKYSVDRSSYSEALGCVNMAWSLASGSVGLSESKLTLLSNMKRWREVAGFCERLAAFNVRLDNVFREDLVNCNPFPGASPAIHLKSNFFGNSREEDALTRDLKLNSKASAEAVLRLPYTLMPYYLRALRLEERYPAADAALRSLEEFVHQAPSHLKRHVSQLTWIVKERDKLTRTKHGRERGDELFRTGDFDLASGQYTNCLTIDGEGLPESTDGNNGGGRLHAVLHCNRAACFMALKRYNDAVKECTAALKIHPRYMKAILRRARCYTRLSQTDEAIAEYKRWLELIEEAAKPHYAASLSSPCLFDGPSDVKSVEITQVKKELDDIYNNKRRAEAAAREEADRRREREKWAENFSSSWQPNNDAQQRRDQWYDQKSGSRFWDSFRSERPASSSRPKPQSESFPSGRNQQQFAASPRADETRDHYSVLNLEPNAKMEDIKKAFRKLAVKYHPDKNKDEGATENFLRIKLAHDTLSDPVKRMQYDSDLRRKRF